MSNRLIQINSRLAIPRPLDVVAATPYLAVSVARRLRGAHTGNLLRIRRDSDNAELDVGQAGGGVMDRAAANIFSAGTDSWVAILYDQTGNVRDLVQATAGDQPQFVDGLVFRDSVTKLPFIQFSTHDMRHDDAAMAQPTTLVMAFKPLSHQANGVLVGGGSTSSGHDFGQSSSGTLPFVDAGFSVNGSVGVSTGSTHIVGVRVDGSSTTIRVDGSAEDIGLVAGANTPEGITLGANEAGANNTSFNFFELLVYNAALSDLDLSALMANLNAYYRAY